MLRTLILQLTLFASIFTSTGFAQDLKSVVEKEWTELRRLLAGPISFKSQSIPEGDSQKILRTETRQDGNKLVLIYESQFAVNEVWGINHAYSFHLQKPPNKSNAESGNWLIDQLHPVPTQSSVSHALCQTYIERPGTEFLTVGTNRIVYLPDVLTNEPNDDGIEFSNLKFEKNTGNDTNEFVTMTFDVKAQNKAGEIVFNYVVALDPSNKHLPVRCDFETLPGKSPVLKGVNEFLDFQRVGKISFPSKTLTYVNGAKSYEVAISSVSLSSIPDSEFRLSAFGLPEPPWARPSTWFSWWWLAGALGLAFLGLLYRFGIPRR